MADPRTVGPQMRRPNHTPLMQALMKRAVDGSVVNFCPFGCQDDELDDNGYCGHLIGFYNGGSTYEPRVRRSSDKRVIVSGKQRKPMEKGFVRVAITTTARVYSLTPANSLIVKRDEAERVLADIQEREKSLIEAAERIRTPVLEGVWEDTEYDLRPVAAAATPDSAK